MDRVQSPSQGVGAGLGTLSALDSVGPVPQQSAGVAPAVGSVGLVPVLTNAEIDEMVSAKADAEAAESQVLSGLAGHVRKCWDAAVTAKQEYQEKMVRALNQRRGIYEPDVLSLLRERGGAEIFMMLTDEKCVGCEAWLEELLLPADDKPWGLKPTPAPDLPPDVTAIIKGAVEQRALQDIQMGVQTGAYTSDADIQNRMAALGGELREALEKFARMMDEKIEKRIEDVVAESGWRGALKEFISHLTTFPGAVLKGPVPRMRKTMKWQPAGGGFEPKVVEEVEPDFEAVSPFDLYPSPMSKGVDDGYLLERHRLTRSDLAGLKGIEGYSDSAIDEVLERGGTGLTDWLFTGMDQTRNMAEGRSFEQMDPEGRIDAVQFWGYVQGQMLIDWGMDSEMVEDPLREYSAEVWLIGSSVVRAVLNEDPMGRKPYYVSSFRKIPGSFWGMGLCEVIADIQGVCNSAARAIVNNMGLSSGPQVGVDIGSMPDGEDVTEMFPWKIWQFDMAKENGTRPPMWFFQPNSVTGELLKIYEYFSNEADNKSGIPRYATGQEQSGGALNTASGLSMMLSNAARGIKRVVKNIDFDVIEPSIQRRVEWEFLYNPDKMYKGDIKILARGSTAMLQKEMTQMRQNEFLRLLLSSPVAMTLAGEDGTAETLRRVAQGLDLGLEQFIPNESDRKRTMFQMLMQNAAGGPESMAGGAAPGLGGGGSSVPTPRGESTPGAPQRRAPAQGPDGNPSGGADAGAARGMVR